MATSVADSVADYNEVAVVNKLLMMGTVLCIYDMGCM
jgi:hypothetical protein